MNALCKLASRLLLIPLSVVLFGQYALADRTYTLDADFDEGTLVNVNHDAPYNDQLQLNVVTSAFPFINVAASSRGTVVRINTETGAIVGEYRTAPEGRGLNPSRTTVDLFGNVWTGNRDEIGLIDGIPHGSVVKIGLVVGGTRVDADGTANPVGDYLQPPFGYNTCADRDSDGLIKTSKGLGDIRPWPDITDGLGGATALVEDADDECILIYQRVSDAEGVRHVSVDASNNVWVGGYPYAQRNFYKLDGSNGAVLTSFDARWLGCGGYGGLIDGNGILWSASISQGNLLRYDPATETGFCLSIANSYGLGVDTSGYIWNSQWTSQLVSKISDSGVIEAGFPKYSGGDGSRGVAVTPANDHVWIAHSFSNYVSRLDNTGSILKIIPVGDHPTGVAVDADGKVWVTNLYSDNVMRIDPAAGADGLGAVDLTVYLGAGAGPYNYSDMTGAVVTGSTSPQGFWTVVRDGGASGMAWGTITWNTEPEASEPAGSSITVDARAADTEAGLGLQSFVPVSNGAALSLTGRYIEIRTTLKPDPSGISPVLSDLSVVEISDDEPPIASNLVVSPNPVAVNTPIAITANIDDSTTGNSNILSAHYTVDGGVPVAMTASDSAFDSPDEDVSASTSFLTAGVHTVCVHGYDVNVSEPSNEVCALLAVYDPSAGFVTGGGWIDSPAGSYAPDPVLFGKATFGFVSKYKRGQSVPDGNTQFQFHAADMKFKSTAYDWLVIAGKRAQYKGIGTINGVGNYGFMLFGIDGDLMGGDGIDKFRIKIWDKGAGDVVVYDNEVGTADDSEATTALGGGSIVIHSR